MPKQKLKQEEVYTAKILGHLSEIFSEDCEYHIDKDELLEGSNATHFMHALATLVPNLIYTRLTDDQLNNLQFNHLANQLVFQYSNLADENQ